MLGNFVLENANNPGTGTLSLAGAPAGRRTFLQSFSAGTTVYYVLDDGLQQEFGYGMLAAGPPATLTRNPISGGLRNFTGPVRVYSALPAERALWKVADGGRIDGQNLVLDNLGAGTSDPHATRLDQVGWTLLQRQTVPAGASAAIFSLPSRYARFRIEYQDFKPQAAAGAYVRFSINGGANYAQGVADYQNVSMTAVGGTVSANAPPNSYLPLTGGMYAGVPCLGALEFQSTGGLQWLGQAFYSGPSGLAISHVAGFLNLSGTISHALVSFVGTNIAGGRIRLLGGLI